MATSSRSFSLSPEDIEDIERSISPTTRQTRLRHMSKGYVDVRELKPSLISDSNEGRGLMTRLLQSRSAQRVRSYLRQRARNDYILCCLPKKNRWRKRVKSLVNSRWFNGLVASLIIIHCIVLAIYQTYTARDYKPRNLNLIYVTAVFELIYIVEACLRIIAAGLIMHPSSYLRKFSNVVDMFVIIISIVFMIGPNNCIFETLSALIALRLLKVMIPIKTIHFLLRALAKSLLPLLYVAWMTFCIMVFFALVGVEIFRGGLHSACYVNYTDSQSLTQKQYRVNDFPCSVDNLPGSHNCTLISDRSHCGPWETGPHSQLVGFDNIGSGLLTVFQCITLEGWTSVLYLYESAYGTRFVWLYFILLISFGSIFMLNLLLGVLTGVFIAVSNQQETQGHLRQLKEKKKTKEDLEGYRHWLERGKLEEDEPSRNTSRSVSLQRQLTQYDVDDSDSDGIEEEEEEENEEQFDENYKPPIWHPLLVYNKKSRSLVRHFVRSHHFFWFMMVVICTNFILLTADSYPSLYEWQLTLFIINYIYTAVYILEFVLKFYGLGPKSYFSSKFNRFDFVFTVSNIMDILIFAHIHQIYFQVSAIVNACRAIRLISAFKYTRYWNGMKRIITTFSDIWVNILSVLIVLGSFTFGVSLLGMRLFGTRLTAYGSLYPSFDDFLDAFLLVFQLSTTEDWHAIMYRTALREDQADNQTHYRLSNVITVTYYVFAIIFGGFIIVNIILAIAIDKLSEVDAIKKDSSERTEQRQETRREREEQILALKNPNQQSGLSQTLRRVLVFYSANLKQQEEQRLTRHRRRSKRTWNSYLGNIKTERSLSVPQQPLSASARRESYGTSRAISDPITPKSQIDFNDGGKKKDEKKYFQHLVPQKVSMVNPFSKFVKMQTGRVSTKRDSLEMSRYEATPTCNDPLKHQTSVNSGLIQEPIIEEEEESVFDDKNCSINSLNSVSLPDIEKEREGPNITPPSCNITTPPTSMTSSSPPIHNITTSLTTLTPPITNIAPPTSSMTPPPMDVSIARLVRKSSLEEVDHVMLPVTAEGNGSERENILRDKRYYKVWLSFKSKALFVLKWLSNYLGTIVLDPRDELKEIPNHSSFFILAPDNRLREWCYKIIKSKPFQTITLTVICLSSILLALESPLPGSDGIFCGIQRTLVFFDIFCLMWFMLEFCLKLLALGVFLHKGSYFHCLFNIIDFFVLVTTTVPIVTYYMFADQSLNVCLSYSQILPIYYSNLPRIIDVTLVLRALRPLRVLRVEGLFFVTKGLFASLKRMVYVFFVGVVLLLIFAVIGVIVFKGRFFYCSDLVTTTQDACQGQYFTYPSNDIYCPRVLNRTWNRWDLHFDHIGWSFLSIYTMITKEGWQDIMYHAMESTGINTGPQYNAHRENLIYFVIFMVLVTFFLINLLVGFVIVTFQQVGIKSHKEAHWDRNQENCLYLALTYNPRKRYIPQWECHKTLYQIIYSKLCQTIIYVAILINVILLSLQYYGMPKSLLLAVYWANVGFTVFFTMEAILKVSVLTPTQYFRSPERSFEFLIVIGSILELMLQSFIYTSSSDIRRYSHLVSSIRVLRLIQITRNTRLIVWTVVRSLQIFPWVGVFLIVLLYTYAVIGMQVFGQIEAVPIDYSNKNAIHQYNNFVNFPQALLVMIRCFTGENWERIMLTSANGKCAPGLAHNETHCGSSFTYFFYPSFFFLSAILVLNLFVAIVIDNFDYLIRDKAILGSHDLTQFTPLWAKMDPKAIGKIHHTDMIKMMRSINPPLGWGRLCPQITCYRRMIALGIPLDEDGMITFHATLFAIVRQALKIDTQNCQNAELREKLHNFFPNCPKTIAIALPERAECTTSEEYAALFIQQYWRKWKLKMSKQNEAKGPGQQKLNTVMRRVPDMGPALLQRRLTTMNVGIGQLALSPSNGSPNTPQRGLVPSSPSHLSPSHSPSSFNRAQLPPTSDNKDSVILTSRRPSQLIKLETVNEDNSTTNLSPPLPPILSPPVPSPPVLSPPVLSPPIVSPPVLSPPDHSPPDHSPPSLHSSPPLSSTSLIKRQSTISESDAVFATPTGSVTSLNSSNEDGSFLPLETTL